MDFLRPKGLDRKGRFLQSRNHDQRRALPLLMQPSKKCVDSTCVGVDSDRTHSPLNHRLDGWGEYALVDFGDGGMCFQRTAKSPPRLQVPFLSSAGNTLDVPPFSNKRREQIGYG